MAEWSYTTWEVLALAASLYAVFLISLLFILIHKSHDLESDYDKFTIPKIIVGIFLLFTCLSRLYICEIKEEVLLKNIESGYFIYLNGIRVEADTIDIMEYSNIKVCDEKKYIIITVRDMK